MNDQNEIEHTNRIKMKVYCPQYISEENNRGYLCEMERDAGNQPHVGELIIRKEDDGFSYYKITNVMHLDDSREEVWVFVCPYEILKSADRGTFYPNADLPIVHVVILNDDGKRIGEVYTTFVSLPVQGDWIEIHDALIPEYAEVNDFAYKVLGVTHVVGGQSSVLYPSAIDIVVIPMSALEDEAPDDNIAV